MTTQRWRQIEEIYRAAADMDPAEQRSFVERACGSDQELCSTVRRLLAADECFDVSVETAIRDEAEALAAEVSGLIIGKRIGLYRITAVIGSGGMGTIYRAARDDDQYQKEVAIKVVKRGMDLDAVIHRFRHERQILARLEHANIARLIDGGVTEDGQPYFVMEYVEGQPLTDYCAPLRLSERLGVFRQVCAAVQYAHDKRILHRDLKPANILVTKDGIPKLLDFGLGKVLSTEELPQQTHTFLRMLTPDYASPEQVRGEVSTKRSDIYSLGAVLYELVSGKRAHRFKDRSAAEIEHIICEQDPLPIPGDLGSIVQKAMQKEPERRYDTVEELSEDVRRYLENLPVSARRRGLAHRVRKFIRRNRVSVAALVCALLSIIGGITVAVRPGRSPAPMQVRPINGLPGNEEWPDLSPDGKHVVFTWRQDNHTYASLYVMAVDGGSAPVRLTNDAETEYDWSAAWSPDGQQIAFRRGRSIYLISALGGKERKLADDPQASSHLSWSPDGKWLATAKYPAAYSQPAVLSEMALISTETGERRVLSRRDPPVFDDAPVFSADGKRLAYMACRNGSSCEVVLQGINPSSGLTGEPLRLAAPGEMHTRLTWSPDQHWIVYSRRGAADVQGLWRVSAKGRTPAERMPLPGERLTFPAFARTGNRLLATEEHLDVDILSLSLSGSLPPTSTGPLKRWAWSTRVEQRPDFSPDGSKVVFVSARTGTSDLWVADADGSNVMQLTNHFGNAEGAPKWSPDGRSIAFTSFQSDNADIWLMDADAGRKRRLTHWPSMEAEPSWTRDGRSIYFRSERTGTSEIWRVPVAGGEPEQITTQGGYLARESADGKLLYYIKQPSSPLFAKALGGRAERQVLDWVHQRSFVVTGDGIYYMGRRDADKNTAPLVFYEFRSGRNRFIRAIDANPAMALAVSPDLRTILLPVFDPPDGNPSSDLMLIENFH